VFDTKVSSVEWAALLLLAAVLGVVGLFVHHNVSWWPPWQRAFRRRLDRAIDRATERVVSWGRETNYAMLFMLSDIASLSGDRRLGRIVDDVRSDPSLDSFWHRLFDPGAGATPPTREELDRRDDHDAWLAFALAPLDIELRAAERAAMFAPDRFVWGSRTHQLFAVVVYRDRVDGSPGVQQLIDHLCEGIAAEARWDVRVTDLYMQRLAFILWAGRSDLVRRRWVERAIACQKPSGGWVANWCGWGPRILQFRLRPMSPNSHTTIQALWLLAMLKHRYPKWIDEH
jgi:hypothetical protein